MPTYTINPNNVGTVAFALAGVTPLVDYAAQVTEFRGVPSPNLTTTAGTYGGAPFDTPGLSSWAINISFLQDWGNTPSLSKFTKDNDGKVCDFEFTSANPAICPSLIGQASVTATDFGGLPGEAWSVASAQWSCPVEPTVVDDVVLTSASEVA